MRRRGSHFSVRGCIFARGGAFTARGPKLQMFRIWANRVLNAFIIKGYVMDDERLKEPENFFGKDYFEEQLERIRDIRSSERRFYQKITDIYSQCSADYDVDSPITKDFFCNCSEQTALCNHTAFPAAITFSSSEGALLFHLAQHPKEH